MKLNNKNDEEAVKGLTQLPGAPIYWLADGTPVYIGSKR